MERNKKPITIIVGPTSSGKTSLALELCKKLNGVIISADSRQVFKEMDIGTGKTPINRNTENIKKGNERWVIDEIDIWGYDLTTPDTYFSAYDWTTFATNKINEILNNSDKKIFIVGGTGFYIDVLIGRKTLAGVGKDKEIRAKLETTPTKNLIKWLTSLNKEKAKKIDEKNRTRIIRTLEIELQKEKITKQELKNLLKLNISYDIIGLNTQRTVLYSKVDMWLDAVWKEGLIEETKQLMKKYPESKNLSGIVYKNAIEFINNLKDEETAQQEAKYALHAYIRRQLTWFRSNKEINWLDITNKKLIDKAINLIE